QMIFAIGPRQIGPGRVQSVLEPGGGCIRADLMGLAVGIHVAKRHDGALAEAIGLALLGVFGIAVLALIAVFSRAIAARDLARRQSVERRLASARAEQSDEKDDS